MLDRPFFGSDNARNITALANGDVTLKCTVKNKGNTTVRHCRDYWHEFLINHLQQFRQVSWIRRRDLAILTSNTFVYTTDTRFSVIHIPDSHNWDLRVKSLTEKDSGVREVISMVQFHECLAFIDFFYVDLWMPGEHLPIQNQPAYTSRCDE